MFWVILEGKTLFNPLYTGGLFHCYMLDEIPTFKFSLEISHSEYQYFIFQHLMFTCIHKHYSIDAWKDFAAENKNILEVSPCLIYSCTCLIKEYSDQGLYCLPLVEPSIRP